MKAFWQKTQWMGMTVVGSSVFAAGFALFLLPNGISTGGVSGLAMLLARWLGFGSVGQFSILINVPLFLWGGQKLGKKFFFGSIVGMLLSSVLIDAFSAWQIGVPEPLVGGIYGGVVCGLGLGMVFSAGTSTGGSDIVVRMLKRHYRDVPVGSISMCFDATVVLLTGLVFRDMTKVLYSGIVLFLSGRVLDAVVYRFDDSRVALIISAAHERIVRAIGLRLDRGATYLDGQGTYTGRPVKVILSVVKKRQLAELKELIMEIDPDAFVIVQEAHQVLGDGFSHYSRDL